MLSLFCKPDYAPGNIQPGGVAGHTYGDSLDAWLWDTRLRVKKSTFSTYLGIVERHIRPQLGDIPTPELTSAYIAKFLLNAEKNLSVSTMRLVCHIVRSSLQYARGAGAPVPPDTGISPPRAARHEARVLSASDQQKLEAELRSGMDEVRLGLLICMYTGLRLGEICALRWGDISPDGTIMTIRRTVQRIKDPDSSSARTILVFDSPKSASSNRRIPVPASLSPLLAKFRADDECFLLTGSAGTFIEPRRMQSRFKSMLRAAGVPDINFHALRHTFATNCVALGCDATTLSRILGHSDVSVTLNTYVHPSFDAMRAMMDKL